MKPFVRGYVVPAGFAAMLWLGTTSPTQAQVRPKESMILKGAPMGGVKFEHALHSKRAADKCETCHHVSKPEKPSTAAQQPCMECHTKPLQPGMKTGRQAAFHNSVAQAGMCVDCHKKANAAGKMAPAKCAECHKKENL